MINKQKRRGTTHLGKEKQLNAIKIRDTQTFNIFHLKLRYKTEQHNQLHHLVHVYLCKKIGYYLFSLH